MTTPRTIIVVPCYNEASRLPRENFLRFARETDVARFIFVNDGSTDDTQSALDALAAEAPDAFSVLALAQNAGKAEAVRRGLLAALDDPLDADHVGFWDADLSTPLEAIPKFIKKIEADPALTMVIGARVRLLGRRIERRAARHYLGRIFATCASLTLSLPVYDTQCGAKLFRRDPHARALFEAPFLSRWVFDVEVIARLGERLSWDLGKLERAIHELPLDAWRDVAGSKLKPMDFPSAFIDLAQIYARYR